jgi:hypothetical protein
VAGFAASTSIGGCGIDTGVELETVVDTFASALAAEDSLLATEELADALGLTAGVSVLDPFGFVAPPDDAVL